MNELSTDSSMPNGFKILETKVTRNRLRFWKKQKIIWIIQKEKEKCSCKTNSSEPSV